VSAVQQSERTAKAGPTSDEEARAKLLALEEHVGSFEGDLREALELGRTSVKAGGGSVTSAAWWNKITSSGKKAQNIKASDGQDMTELIRHLVDSDVASFQRLDCQG
jgi:SUN domain-containing protein 1/2